MKLSHTLLILVASATVVFARFVILDDNAKPMSLPAGYDLAVKALGSSTNQFHCISAAIAGPGWFFDFCTTNTPPKYKWVTVVSGSEVHVEDGDSNPKITNPE
jgi:hypothetical protein